MMNEGPNKTPSDEVKKVERSIMVRLALACVFVAIWGTLIKLLPSNQLFPSGEPPPPTMGQSNRSRAGQDTTVSA